MLPRKDGKAAIEVAIINHNGQVMAFISQPVQHMTLVHAIEAQAITQEYELAGQIGVSDFVIESDSQEIVRYEKRGTGHHGPYEDFTQFGHFFNKKKSLKWADFF